eukprot:50890-Chlamydomonas_euryale.AAC.6
MEMVRMHAHGGLGKCTWLSPLAEDTSPAAFGSDGSFGNTAYNSEAYWMLSNDFGVATAGSGSPRFGCGRRPWSPSTVLQAVGRGSTSASAPLAIGSATPCGSNAQQSAESAIAPLPVGTFKARYSRPSAVVKRGAVSTAVPLAPTHALHVARLRLGCALLRLPHRWLPRLSAGARPPRQRRSHRSRLAARTHKRGFARP